MNGKEPPCIGEKSFIFTKYGELIAKFLLQKEQGNKLPAHEFLPQIYKC